MLRIMSIGSLASHCLLKAETRTREIDGLPVSEAEFQRRVGNGAVGLGKVDSKGNVYFAGNTLDFGTSVWIDDWNLTYSTSNTEFPLTALPDGSVVMKQGPSVTVNISRSGHFITAANGLKLVTSLSPRRLLPQNPTYSSGGQLSPCLRDTLRQFFPVMKAHGRSYSPVDDARFKSGIPTVVNTFQDNDAVTLGLYDIHFNPDRVNLNGGTFSSLDTILEEVAHTVQFSQLWAESKYPPGGTDPGYGEVKNLWAARYFYYAAKGRWQNGDGYKNDVEKWAKNRKFDILNSLLSDKKLVQAGNVCGYDLTNPSVARPDW